VGMLYLEFFDQEMDIKEEIKNNSSIVASKPE
jgi:hypothetical protein